VKVHALKVVFNGLMKGISMGLEPCLYGIGDNEAVLWLDIGIRLKCHAAFKSWHSSMSSEHVLS
jgi:hypothetical protein